MSPPAADPGLRSFVAILLPEAVRQRIDEAAEGLRRAMGGVAWVRRDNLHVTLRFLGSQDAATLERVAAALRAAAAGVAPFRIRLAGFGAFPSPRAPRVLWAGVAGGVEGLVALSGVVEAALARCDLPPEGRPFHPHVTLGRVRDPRRPAARPLALPGDDLTLGEVQVTAVHLVRSDLQPGGARYSVLAEATLGGAAGGGRFDLPGGGP